MSEAKQFLVEATSFSGLNKHVLMADVAEGMKPWLLAIPLTYDPARVTDEAYVQELRDTATKTFSACIKGLGSELLRTNGHNLELTCEDCGAKGEFARTWPVDFCVGAKMVCYDCMVKFIRAEGRAVGLGEPPRFSEQMEGPPKWGTVPRAPDGRPMKWFKPIEVTA